jgi:N-acyl-D-aspartate/D-glutamate deacylase
MADTASIVIRNGTIVDGTGAAPFRGDVAIIGDRIVAVGQVAMRGEREIDATGLLVTPGFIDIHTHYDAQAMWSNRLDPSSWNGVTTAMIGNCGVGFAPCRPEQRDMLVALMEGVEDIPEVVMTEGLDWDWETFPDFLDRLDARQFDLDIVAQVPHAAIRVYVMGERGFRREPSTDAERREMARLAVEGMKAGAVGFSTSRAIAHRTLAGEPTPTLGSAEEELAVIAEAIGDHGAGWLQVISDFDEPEEEFALLRRVAERSKGRAISLTFAQREGRPRVYRQLLDLLTEANAAGVPMLAQVMGRPIAINLGFELSINPFCERPSYKAIAQLPFAERLVALRTPALRAALLAETTGDAMLRRRLNSYERMFELGDPANYEPHPDDSLAGRAARAGVPVEEFVYDLLVAGDGRTTLYRPLTNYVEGNLDVCLEMMRHPNTVMGLGDGGAHYSFICDSSTVTHSLMHWTRDRTRGERVSLPWMVRRLTRDAAAAIGLLDRGVIAPGYKADINVIDYDGLAIGPLRVAYDLPAGGRRLIQRVDGYVATILSGVVVTERGAATGTLPGRLVRGTQPAPAAARMAAE